MSHDPLDNEWDFKDCRLENNGVIPKTCGYNKTFRYKVPLNAHGVMGNLIDWCVSNCKHKWGWHFENTKEEFSDYEPNTHWGDQRAIISFSSKKEAFMFKLKAL
tara:strand:- start:4579 stop:4890 length:312 start_codon:yes stop_codon:yes gene_type:complete